MARVPESPRRRTYKTGESLPALTSEWRPIQLGFDEQGDPDSRVRAFAVLLRNRSNNDVEVREGPDADDAMVMSAGEDYRIFEPNGISTIAMRGASGGEDVEVRALEAHNDFEFTDKIEAFVRAVSHFFATATTNTTITGQNVDLNIDDAAGLNIDVQAQSIGDIRTINREGFTEMRHLTDGTFEGTEQNTWTLYSNADFDGSLESMSVRVNAPASHETTFDLDGIGAHVQIDRGSTGSWSTISPQRAHSAFLASRIGGQDIYVANYSASRECVYTYSPDPGLYFEEGDSLRIIIGDDGNTVSGVQTDYNIEVNVEINKRERL